MDAIKPVKTQDKSDKMDDKPKCRRCKKDGDIYRDGLCRKCDDDDSTSATMTAVFAACC